MTDHLSLNQQLGTDQIVWNLADLYEGPDDSRLESDIAWCKKEAAAINHDFQGSIAGLPAAPLAYLVQRLETLDARLGRLATFAFLNYTTQVTDHQAGALYQSIIEITNQCGKATIFFELEWNQLDETAAEQLFSAKPCEPYRHYLSSMRRYRPHQLEAVEERLLLEMKSVGRKSWTTLFDKVIGNLRFGEAGRTEQEVLSDLYHPQRHLRQQAATDLTAGLQSQAHILCHIYNTLAAEKMIVDRLRNHQEWVSSMNLDNQISDQTVTTLIDSVVSRYDIVNRYYHLKKSLLGLDSLYDYDRYAPLPSLPSEAISWHHCRTMVLDAFSAFSDKMATIAELFFNKSWLHAPVNPGKRGGAFAHPGVAEVHPYIMVNYTGTLRDVATVAHELGHGVHQVLAAQTGYYNSNTPLVLAETASVFAELLVFKSQLAALTDPQEKRAFICQKLESIMATVFRQVAMNRFEQRLHQGRRTHGELSADTLGDYWLETQQEMFGDSVELRADYRVWWSYIPHFLSTPGYVYSYAFGELLVLALYASYQKSESDFVEKYLELLAAGGSDTPERLLQPFAIDLHDQAFWLQGLALIDSLLQEVEQLG